LTDLPQEIAEHIGYKARITVRNLREQGISLDQVKALMDEASLDPATRGEILRLWPSEMSKTSSPSPASD